MPGLVGVAGGGGDPPAARRPVQPGGGRAGAHPGAVPLDVPGERRPDGRGVVPVRAVEGQPLRVAEQVEVELGDHLGGRHLRLVVEERVREDLEEHGPGPVRQPQRGEQLVGGPGVELGVGALRVVGEQRQRRGPVHRPQVDQAHARAAQQQGEQVGRRRGRQPAELLGRPARGEDRIAGDRLEEAERRVGPAQDVPPVPVLPEEGVEAVLVALDAVRQLLRPGAEPAAQVRRRLQHGHPDAAFGQHHRRRHAGDAAADHHGPHRPGYARGATAAGVHQVPAYADEPADHSRQCHLRLRPTWVSSLPAHASGGSRQRRGRSDAGQTYSRSGGTPSNCGP
ncbi:hypothetical protein B0E53_05968 [Micromonospora sp. MH33]|nr:hypothetical protein B0E53_05968 [Micromonospora sp. MH33]